MFPGNVDAYLANVEERREHDRRVNATTLTKRRQLETFIAKNRARASTASQAKSKAKQLERLQLIHVDGPESSVQFRFPDIEPRQGPAVRTRASGDRLSRSHGRPRCARRRSTTARASASWATTARARRRSCARSAVRSTPIGGRGQLGLRLPGRRLCPARLHDAARTENGAGISRIPGRAENQHAANQRRGRQLAVQRRDDRKANPRAERRRAGPAGAGRLAASAAQHAGARRAGQPSRRRIGRSAGRGADRLSAAR